MKVLLLNGSPHEKGNTYTALHEMQTVFDAIEKADCMKEKESCILFRGSVVTKEEEQKLLSSIQERYPLLDVSLVNSGQSLYRWQIGLY